MKFSPRLIVVENGCGLADALEALDYWLIRVEATPQDQTRAFEKALAITSAALDRDPTIVGSGTAAKLGLSIKSTLEQDRPFLPNKATEPAQSVTGFTARAVAELLAVGVILHGLDRVRQGPHCVVLSSAILRHPEIANQANPSESIGTPWQTGKNTTGPLTMGVCSIQPDSGSGECFDIPDISPQSIWDASAKTRLLELLEHWSFHPGRPSSRP